MWATHGMRISRAFEDLRPHAVEETGELSSSRRAKTLPEKETRVLGFFDEAEACQAPGRGHPALPAAVKKPEWRGNDVLCESGNKGSILGRRRSTGRTCDVLEGMSAPLAGWRFLQFLSAAWMRRQTSSSEHGGPGSQQEPVFLRTSPRCSREGSLIIWWSSIWSRTTPATFGGPSAALPGDDRPLQ